MSNQFLKYVQDEIRDLISKKDDSKFAYDAQRYALEEYKSHSMDVLIQLPPDQKN